MMKHVLLGLMAAALLGGTAQAASAAKVKATAPPQAAKLADIHAAREADLRCMVIARNAGASPDENLKAAFAMASFFFLGRLEGREPNLDLESALANEMEAMKSLDVRAEATRCGDELVNQGAEMRAVDEGLARRAQQQPS